MTRLRRRCDQIADQYEDDPNASLDDLAGAIEALVLEYMPKKRRKRKGKS